MRGVKVNEEEHKPFIDRKPFQRYNEEKVADTFTIRLNEEERQQLEIDKKVLMQEKDSTALKQLAELGRIVLHSKKTIEILDIIRNNERRNKRIGINEF